MATSTPSDDITIRAPLASRIHVSIFCTVFVGFTGWLFIRSVSAGEVAGSLMVLVFFVIAPLLIAAVPLRQLVQASASGLLVRNGLKTVRFTRDEIAEFRTLENGSQGTTILVQTVDGRSVVMRATQAGPFSFGRAKAQRRAADLNMWLRTR